MMTVMSVGVFAGTLGVSIYAIAATVAPRLDQIAAALRGQPQARHLPLASLVQAERRIAVRRWSQSRPSLAIQTRAAA